MPIIISGDPTKSISLTGDQSKSIQASQVTATTSSDPPYVISGLEQSHWLAENATLLNGRVNTIPDYLGSNATLSRLVQSDSNNFQYNATGWQLNGKTLPALVAPSNGRGLVSSAWGTKLSGYTGAFTAAYLWEPVAASLSWWLYNSNKTNYQYGYELQSWDPPTQPFLARVHRLATSGRASGLNGSVGQNGTAAKQLIVMEYTGTSAATPVAQFRLWINGNEITLTSYEVTGNGGRSSIEFSAFELGPTQVANAKFAQFHFYKGALTDTQRNDVTAYLKSISGIA